MGFREIRRYITSVFYQRTSSGSLHNTFVLAKSPLKILFEIIFVSNGHELKGTVTKKLLENVAKPMRAFLET